MERKRFYVSERITNISDLEAIHEKEQIVIGVIKKELEKKAPSIEELNGAVMTLEGLNKKAINFEFCLERRKTYN